MPNRGLVTKTIGGVEHKLCTGPLHRDGRFIPLNDFYSRSNGRVRSQCKSCEGAHVGTEVMVPYGRIKFAVDELVFRLGKAETARRVGVKLTTIWEWTTNKRKFVHRRTARSLIVVLAHTRSKQEVRHKLSIKHGASQRGRVEREPRKLGDFNGPNDTEAYRAKTRREKAAAPMRGKYLCGCDPNHDRIKNYTVTVLPNGGLTNKRYDREGYEICPIHGRRLYGWNTMFKTGPQGNQIADHKSKFEHDFGKTDKSKEIPSTVEDRRMNQDQEEIGLAVLESRATMREYASASKNGQGDADTPIGIFELDEE